MMSKKNDYNTLEEKSGKPLELSDILFLDKHERESFLPILEDLYGLKFKDGIEFSSSLSLTSRKCLIYDTNNNKYFLKRKPEYSLEEPLKSRSVILQKFLSDSTNFVPKVIYTKNNEPYAVINKNHYLLTPFIEGGIFSGNIEQCLDGASKLGVMHRLGFENLPKQAEFTDSTTSALTFLGYARNLHFENEDLKNETLDKIEAKMHFYSSHNKGLLSWIHSDFAPFNLVYTSNIVVAVNDFDNATYGNISKDLAECLISFCDINYAGTTSSLNKVIREKVDNESMVKLFRSYLNSSRFGYSELHDLPNEMSIMWLKLMVLGLLRGDFTLDNLKNTLSHADLLNEFGFYLIDSIKNDE